MRSDIIMVGLNDIFLHFSNELPYWSVSGDISNLYDPTFKPTMIMSECPGETRFACNIFKGNIRKCEDIST